MQGFWNLGAAPEGRRHERLAQLSGKGPRLYINHHQTALSGAGSEAWTAGIP